MYSLPRTWVKSAPLRGASFLIAATCVKNLYPEVFRKLSQGRVALITCPEDDNSTQVMGKLASMVRCSKPKDIVAVSIEGSPHCLLIHAAVNEALFVLGEKIPTKHYVVLNGELIEIEPEAVRVARYLHLVDRLIKEKPEILETLRKYSLEYKWASSGKPV